MKDIPQEVINENNGWVKSVIEDEGIGYAVQHYMDSTYILDPTTKKMWDEAQAALENLERYLKPFAENWDADLTDFEQYIEKES